MERVVRERVVRIFVALWFGALVLGAGASGFAKDKPKNPPATAAKGKLPPGQTVNACGCYRTESGSCVCTDKKGKCECPGECEPVGCGEKRDKEIEREMAAEIKRAQDDEKKREADREAKEKGTAAPDAGEGAPAVATQNDSQKDSQNDKPPTKPRKNAPAKTDKSDSKAEKPEKK
jgi:hypothetical protein